MTSPCLQWSPRCATASGRAAWASAGASWDARTGATRALATPLSSPGCSSASPPTLCSAPGSATRGSRVRQPPEPARHLIVLSGIICPRSTAGSPQRLCTPRLPLRHAPAVARALHPVLAAHGAGRGNMHQLCALPLMPWPRLLRATFCGPTPTARPRSTACSAALWHRQPSSLLSCVPRVGGRLWLSLNSQAPAVLPHRPHHPLGAARRGPGAAVLAAHLVRALL